MLIENVFSLEKTTPNKKFLKNHKTLQEQSWTAEQFLGC